MKDPREECENCTCFWVGTGQKIALTEEMGGRKGGVEEREKNILLK